jgi:hypothetical protein
MPNQKGFSAIALLIGIPAILIIVVLLFSVAFGFFTGLLYEVAINSPTDKQEVFNIKKLKNGHVTKISQYLEKYYNNDYKISVINPMADITESTIPDPINPGNFLDAVAFSNSNWVITLMMIKNPEKLTLEEWVKTNASDKACGDYCLNFSNPYKKFDLNESAGIYSRTEKQEVLVQDFNKPIPTKNVYYQLNPELIIWTSAQDKKQEYISETTETYLFSTVRAIRLESTPSASLVN